MSVSARRSALRRARLEAAPFSYPEIGATAGELPAGYHHLTVERPIGLGADRFHDAAERLLSWQMHRRAGLQVDTRWSRVVPGTVAVLRIPLGPGLLRGVVRAPVRVVAVIAEPRRQGFCYGTLPGHPESGEELFLVHHDVDDSVRAEIRAFSRPGRWFTRLGDPVARRLQNRVTDRYLDALAA